MPVLVSIKVPSWLNMGKQERGQMLRSDNFWLDLSGALDIQEATSVIASLQWFSEMFPIRLAGHLSCSASLYELA
jgi:hypothetical protein